MRTQVKASKLPESRENAGDSVASVLHLIGWHNNAKILDQSQTVLKQSQGNSLMKIALYGEF